MDSEVDLLVGSAIDSLVKLEILLFFHARPGSVEKPADIAQRLRRREDEVAGALELLSEAGLIERFSLGSGRHVVYGPSDDRHVQEVIGALHERYHRDPGTRANLVRRALAGTKAERSPG